MDKESLKKHFENFAEGREFKLNPDDKHVDSLAESVLKNEDEQGLKYCPCQVRSGDFDKDVNLICPCDFEAQEVYGKEGRCWCGLFVKR